MTGCCAHGCQNGQDPEAKQTFAIPDNPRMKRKWYDALNRNFDLSAAMTALRVCTKHFEPECFVPDELNLDHQKKPRKKKKLEPWAVPTLSLSSRVLIDQTLKHYLDYKTRYVETSLKAATNLSLKWHSYSLLSSKINVKIKCLHCNFEWPFNDFKGLADLNDHFGGDHPELVKDIWYKCSIRDIYHPTNNCHWLADRSKDFQVYQAQKQGIKRAKRMKIINDLRCPYCEMSNFIYPSYLENHIASKHTFRCSTCEFSAVTKEQLLKHTMDMHFTVLDAKKLKMITSQTMISCSVPNCNFKTKHCRGFQGLPTTKVIAIKDDIEKQRAKWIKLLGLEGIKYPRICFRHFKKTDFVQRAKLKENTLPSQNLPPINIRIKTEPFIKEEHLEPQPFIKEEPMELQPLKVKEEPSEADPLSILGI